MCEETQRAYRGALGHLTRVVNPDRVAKLTTATMTTFVGKLRKEGTKPTTMGYYVSLDADQVAAGLWADYEPPGNTSGNTGPEEAPAATRENLT